MTGWVADSARKPQWCRRVIVREPHDWAGRQRCKITTAGRVRDGAQPGGSMQATAGENCCLAGGQR
jgi:hypothetical protein